jgi:hypothetical protein
MFEYMNGGKEFAQADLRALRQRARIVYLSILGMLTMMLVVSAVLFWGFEKRMELATPITLDRQALLIIGLAGIVLLLAAYSADQALSKKRLADYPAMPINARMRAWWSWTIIRYAVLEGLALLFLLASWYLQQDSCLVFAGLIVVYFILQWPSDRRLQRELLNSSEQ